MLLTLAVAGAFILYLLATALLMKRLRDSSESTRSLALALGLAASVLHGVALINLVFTDEGLNLGFTHMASLATWFIATLGLLTAFRKPVENLGIALLPLAACALLFQHIFPTYHLLSATAHQGLAIHIVLSILAYSLLSLAAVQALLLEIKERHLHNRQTNRLIRALPPLETLEQLLFQMIIIGFVLQSLSLASGFLFLEDMFAQHLVHKTLLSLLAWAVFAILLWGHWRHGWRGRTAVKWTLSGFAALLLAYFGSKYVLEIILQR